MKSRKRYGRKIKRTRTKLYRPRKTRGQKIFGTVMLIIAILLIAFLGFCLGKPFLEFIEKSSATEQPEWIPPVQSEAADTSVPETQAPIETTESEIEVSAPVIPKSINAVKAPDAALLNSSSLAAFAAKAKNEGYNTVVLRLKDSDGYFYYASEVAAGLSEELVLGSMTAKEIYSTLESRELKAIAEISVLSDNMGCIADPDMSYKIKDDLSSSWYDYKTGSQVRWANPEKEETRKYFRDICAELKDAGFKIMLDSFIFPDFQDYDRKFIADRYFEESRSAMLLGMLSGGERVEMNAEDIIGEGFGRTAELLREKSFLQRGSIIVKISRSAFPPEDGYPASAASLIEDILALVRTKTGKLMIIPEIDSEGLSTDEIAAIKSLLDISGYKDYIFE